MKELINCPAERAIYFLGGKWKIRILFTLFHNKTVRFNELKKSIKNYHSTNVI
jgi:DNA-binding HxlR family transcriptional regulator